MMQNDLKNTKQAKTTHNLTQNELKRFKTEQSGPKQAKTTQCDPK